MLRSLSTNMITGQTPVTGPALPDNWIGSTGTGTGVGDGVGIGVGVGVGVGAGVGAGEGVVAAACVAFTAVPATTTDTGLAAPEFADTITRTAASPRPDAGVTEAHATPLFAVHVQAV